MPSNSPEEDVLDPVLAAGPVAAAATGRQITGPCFESGVVIFRTHTLSSVSLEEFVRRVRWSDPKVRIDWCFSKCVVEFSAQGDTERAKQAIWSQRHVHDASFRREIRTLFEPHAIDLTLENIWRDFGAVGEHGALRYPPDFPVDEPEAPACALATCIAHLRPCPACMGVSFIDASEDAYPCDACMGSGQAPLLASDACRGVWCPCWRCHGHGENTLFAGGDYDVETCPTCNGHGRVKTWKDRCDQHLVTQGLSPDLTPPYRTRKDEEACQTNDKTCPPRAVRSPGPEPISLPEALAIMATYVNGPVGISFYPEAEDGSVCCTMIGTFAVWPHSLPGASLRGVVKEWLDIAREPRSLVDPPDSPTDIALLESLLARMDASGFGVSC